MLTYFLGASTSLAAKSSPAVSKAKSDTTTPAKAKADTEKPKKVSEEETKVDLTKDSSGLGLSIVGGTDTPLVKKEKFYPISGGIVNISTLTRTTNVVRNAGCARSRYTLNFFLINQWINQSMPGIGLGKIFWFEVKQQIKRLST